MALRVTEQELRDLLVTRLEVIDGAEFERARKVAARLRLPLERAIVGSSSTRRSPGRRTSTSSRSSWRPSSAAASTGCCRKC